VAFAFDQQLASQLDLQFGHDLVEHPQAATTLAHGRLLDLPSAHFRFQDGSPAGAPAGAGAGAAAFCAGR
jgi:hypothetical protein